MEKVFIVLFGTIECLYLNMEIVCKEEDRYNLTFKIKVQQCVVALQVPV